MTKLLERAVQAVSLLPPEDQDEIARAMLRLAAAEDVPEDVPDEDLPAVLEGLAQAERGEFATDEEVEAVFRRFGR